VAGTDAGVAARRRTRHRGQATQAEYVFLAMNAKVDLTGDWVQSAQVRLLSLLGSRGESDDQARRAFEIVQCLHPQHDSSLPVVQLHEAGLITLAGGIVILHFEIHFGIAGQFRLGNGLDGLTFVGGIRVGRERYVFTRQPWRD
jgi:hypothetical protein